MFVDTEVRVDVKVLRSIVGELKKTVETNSDKTTAEGRSAAHQYSTISKFLESVDKGNDIELLHLHGEEGKDSTHISYKPTLMSLAKIVRKSILPKNDGNVFVFANLKVPEILMALVFAQDKNAIKVYREQDDFVGYYRDKLFGTEALMSNETALAVLMAEVYGMDSVSLAHRLAITEEMAKPLIEKLDSEFPLWKIAKEDIVGYGRLKNAYFCPNKFDSTDMQQVCEVDKKKGFLASKAVSTYVHSAFGLWMQNTVDKLSQLYLDGDTTKGKALLSIFDAVFVEMPKSSVEAFRKWYETWVSPFRIETFGYGDTMWNAQNNIHDEEESI